MYPRLYAGAQRTIYQARHWADDYSIMRQGAKHTAIQPRNLSFTGRLYEDFARDFAREFFARGPAPVWLELAYEPHELHTSVMGLDVAARGAGLPNYQEVVVGANVSNINASLVRQSPVLDPRTGALTVISINHGPYVR